MVRIHLFLSILALFLQSFAPLPFKLLPFAPFLTLIILRFSFIKTLCIASFIGMFVDLLTSGPLGIYALSYFSVTLLVFRYKKHFLFEDPFHFSLFTTLFSLLFLPFHFFFLFLFDRRILFEGNWALIDLFIMPVVDGLFAFLWFVCPLLLVQFIKKRWSLFWIRRKRIFQTLRASGLKRPF